MTLRELRPCFHTLGINRKPTRTLWSALHKSSICEFRDIEAKAIEPMMGYSQIRKRIRCSVIKAISYGRFGRESPLIICSSPRSGSTLLTQSLACIPRVLPLFEPLHLDKVPEAKEAGFTWRTFVPPAEEWHSGTHFFNRLFQGKVLNEWILKESSAVQCLRARRLLIKFVRANRLLPWLCSNYRIVPPILLVRHPCAVVASQMQYGMKGKPEISSFADENEEFLEAVRGVSSTEECLAAQWAMDHMALEAFDFWDKLIIVRYEELIQSPLQVFQEILGRWQVDFDLSESTRRLEVPSKVVGPGGIAGADGWKSKLSSEQIKKIQKVIAISGVRLYAE